MTEEELTAEMWNGAPYGCDAVVYYERRWPFDRRFMQACWRYRNGILYPIGSSRRWVPDWTWKLVRTLLRPTAPVPQEGAR